MTTSRSRARALTLALGVALIALAPGLRALRKAFIKDVVTNDAPPRRGAAATPRLPAPPPGASVGDAALPAVERVRVVLLDGVGRDVALALPGYSALCARGLDLAVDVGFPTVSLPVEAALWSGLSQQQSGILYRSGRVLAPPLADGIPAQVPGSIAIAESHPYIVHSLGFAGTQPPLAPPLPDGWADTGFRDAAIAAIAGDARLAFVHVLRADTAGHRAGAASAAYRDAASAADALLGELIAAGDAADRARPGTTRWFVLSDHGHLAPGGHGGEEASIRAVRVCIAGGVAPGSGGPLALADVSRALADSLAVGLPDDARGRPLAVALAAPLDGDALLPRPGPGRWAAALLLLAGAAALTVWAARARHLAWAMAWWPLALASLLALRAAPTLSLPMMYRPLAHDMIVPILGALAVLAIAGGRALLRHRASPVRFAVAALAVPLAAAAAALLLCGGLPWIGDAAPIMPRWTAWASALLTIAQMGALVVGLAVTASAADWSRGTAR